MSSPLLQAEAHRLADHLAFAIAGADRPPIFGQVTTATAGGASDGNYLVKVTRFGKEIPANGYVNTYTPTVNDWVIAVYVDDQLIVLGKVIGKP